MKFMFVSRKKYQIEKDNCILLNNKRAELALKNKELQLKVKELERQVKLLEEELEVYNKNKIEKVAKTPKKTTVKKATVKKTKKKEEK